MRKLFRLGLWGILGLWIIANYTATAQIAVDNVVEVKSHAEFFHFPGARNLQGDPLIPGALLTVTAIDGHAYKFQFPLWGQEDIGDKAFAKFTEKYSKPVVELVFYKSQFVNEWEEVKVEYQSHFQKSLESWTAEHPNDDVEIFKKKFQDAYPLRLESDPGTDRMKARNGYVVSKENYATIVRQVELGKFVLVVNPLDRTYVSTNDFKGTMRVRLFTTREDVISFSKGKWQFWRDQEMDMPVGNVAVVDY